MALFYQYMFPYGFYADVPVTIGLQGGYYSISEDSGSVQICVEVVSGDTAGRSLSINYTTVDGSARGSYKEGQYIVVLYKSPSWVDQVFVVLICIAPGDYTDASGSFLITDGSTEECVSVSIINDSKDEADRECFAFTISTAASNAISLDTTQATICISDDEGKNDCMFSV